MKSDELLERMHEVLDGAASTKDSRELDQLLSQDPVARAEFEDLRRLFTGLNCMPKELPPEDLLSTVTARIPPSPRRSIWRSQLFSRSGVLRLSSIQAQANTAGQPDKTWPVSRFETSSRNDKMSADKGLFSKRIVWIGAGVAAAAVVVATRFFDIPPNSGVGTIVPAQRFQATQPGAGDVNGSAGTDSTQAGAVVGDDSDRAAADRAAADRAATDRAATDRAATDRAATDRAATDRAATDRAASDRAATDRAATDRAATDRAATDRAATDRAATDRAATDRAATDRAATDRAATDRAAHGSRCDGSCCDGSCCHGSCCHGSRCHGSCCDGSCRQRSRRDGSRCDGSCRQRSRRDGSRCYGSCRDGS